MSESARGVTWDLSDLYHGVDDPRIEADLAGLADRCGRFAQAYRGFFARADLTPALLRDCLAEYEAICELMSRLGAYAGLVTAADTACDAGRRLEDRIRQQLVERENQLTFFDLEWLAVDDAAATRLAGAPELANYQHYLLSARRYRPYTRSEPEELLLNQKSLTARAAWTNLFDEFVSAIRYRFEYGGETREMNASQILAIAYDPDRNRRQAAQQCLFDELARHELVLSSILNTVAQDHALNDSVRGHTGPMNSRHLANEVSPGVIDRMLEVAEANYGVAHRYYRLKSRLLGLPKLVTYDQYAPVISNLPSCRFEEGRKSVLEAFARFDPRMEQVASLFFERRWIDAEVRSNKRGGAFSASTVPSVHPYILVNWTDKLRDVSTLAHELGHGIHQYLSRKQTYFNFHHPLTTAETASVMGEFLAFDHMLQTTPDPRVRLGLLCGKIEDAFATVFRQTVLTRFEQLVHEARRRERLSSDQLCDFWWQANQRLYGEAVEMFPPYRWGWAYIPHFVHTPFYCYAYVFGELLVLSLYRMYQQEGQAFVPRYLQLLESGCRESPERLLAAAGADISQPGFWQQGLDVLADMVTRAEELAGQVGAA